MIDFAILVVNLLQTKAVHVDAPLASVWQTPIARFYIGLNTQHVTFARDYHHRIRPTTFEATRAHVVFDGNQLTAELIGAGISCDHNGDMFNPDGYSFSDLDLV